MSRYATPLGFKEALEARLRAASKASGQEHNRLRMRLVIDRFAARVGAEFGDDVVLKGSVVLELRLAEARATKDLTLRRPRCGSTRWRATSPRSCTPTRFRGPVRTHGSRTCRTSPSWRGCGSSMRGPSGPRSSRPSPTGPPTAFRRSCPRPRRDGGVPTRGWPHATRCPGPTWTRSPLPRAGSSTPCSRAPLASGDRPSGDGTTASSWRSSAACRPSAGLEPRDYRVGQPPAQRPESSMF